jgi:hypothetical protein
MYLISQANYCRIFIVWLLIVKWSRNKQNNILIAEPREKKKKKKNPKKKKKNIPENEIQGKTENTTFGTVQQSYKTK